MDEHIVKPKQDIATQEAISAVTPSETATASPTESAPTPEDQKAGDMTIPSDPYYTDPLFYEVVQYFGIEQQGWDKAKNELSVIVDFAILEGKSNKMEDVLLTLRKMEDKLQPPAWGEKRYSNVYKYIRLASQKTSYEKAMSAFEKTGARA